MVENICKPELCTGCAACFSACPKACIQMEADSEGFLRPVIDSAKCISCGKCQKICPINHPIEDNGAKPATYAARVKDSKVLKQSSSGGMFSGLAIKVLSLGGAVIGAGFDEEFQVTHKVCTDVLEIDELRRSKYVQSRMGTVYQDAKALLEKGIQVLFCGTPCQIGGLKAYLGKEYPNLYTVDFICHGVPSPMVWETYKAFREKQANSKITDVSFRSKDKGWKTFSMKLFFEDGSEYSELVSKDHYLRSFIMDLDLRPSCYQCQFKQIHRVSDITIADFWGAEKLNNDWNDDKGVSLALVHSGKGHELLEACSELLAMIPVDFDEAIASNPSMTKSVSKRPLRKTFMRDVQKMPFDKVHEKYCGTGLASKLRRKMSQLRK